LVWQIVLKRNGTPTKRTQFPIYENEAEWSPQANTLRTTVTRNLAGIFPEDFAIIKTYQPFNVGLNVLTKKSITRWHPLAMLSYLNNVDKHRFIHVAYMAASLEIRWGVFTQKYFFHGGRIAADVPPGPLRITGLPSIARYVDGVAAPHLMQSFKPNPEDPAELMRILKPDRPHVEMEMDDRVAVEISFSDIEHPMSIDDLTVMLVCVVNAVDQFRPLFTA
jgi:hypothetical protein